MRTVVWFRDRDLRTADHVPLCEAAAGGEAIPLFVLDPEQFSPDVRPHAAQFLLDALADLEGAIARLGSKLLVFMGPSHEVVPRLAERWQAERVVAYRCVDPVGRARDENVSRALGGRLELFDGETLIPPGTLRSGAGKPYAVFTAFRRAWERKAPWSRPVSAPLTLPPLPEGIGVGAVPFPTCTSVGITRNERVLIGGERAGQERLDRFIAGAARTYDRDRDRMDRDGTSRLSAYLRFGTVSVRTIWDRVTREIERPAASTFQNELVWREFTHSTLYDRPELLREPFRKSFEDFPWRDDAAGWRAWVEGRTGYPLVDAAARQLLHEGFVHNRARMIAASFLTKHLMIDYRQGEAHYMSWLTDWDPAQNNAGWQWSAGCGMDAQPWFRVFNPIRQGERFDPDGEYVRRWLPELAKLPARWIHRPAEASDSTLLAARIRLGEDYPHPILNLASARERYLRVARGCLGSGPTRQAVSRDLETHR